MGPAKAVPIGLLALATGVVLTLDALGVIRGPLHRIVENRQNAPTTVVDTSALPGPGGSDPVLLASTATNSSAATPQGVAAALAGPLNNKALGGDVAVVVIDAPTGKPLLVKRANAAQAPASTAKLVTAFSALVALGPDTRLRTTVVQSPQSITLVGGGDPSLRTLRDPAAPQAPTLAALADQTVAALRASQRTSVTVSFDDSLFTGPTTAASWPKAYVATGVVAPVTALQVDGGRLTPGRNARSTDPSAAAARAFAGLLRDRGISVRGKIQRTRPPTGSVSIAEVQSPPMTTVVEDMLTQSNDDAAEQLAHLVGARRGTGATFAGGARAAMQILQDAGIATEGLALFDGSGLSRKNLIAPATLAGVLQRSSAQGEPTLRGVLTGLPVAGFTGTLADRFNGVTTRSAAGVTRAKTGTLTGVSSLAGQVLDTQGRPMVFVILADRIAPSGTLAGRAAIDRIVTALAACGCR